MNRLFVILALLLLQAIAPPARAQEPANATLQLSVRNERGGPLANTDVALIHTGNGHTVKGRTDGNGTAQFQLQQAGIWQISILKIRDYFKWRVEVQPRLQSRFQQTITYNYTVYERETRPKVDRRKLRLETVAQRIAKGEEPDEKHGIITVTVNRADRSPLSNFLIGLTCYKLGKTFTARTNNGGEAYFKVPIGQEYDIDIDGIEGFKFVDLPDRAYGTAWQRFTYEPTVVDEAEVRDTVTQRLPSDVGGTSGRALVTIQWRNSGGGVWANEPVYLAEIRSNRVYKAITDSQGLAKFLLPIGRKYMLHGKYQRDIDVVNLELTHGVSEYRRSRTYTPDPRFQYPERYIPTPDRLLLTPFERFLDQVLPLPKPGESLLTYAAFGGEVNASSEQAVLKIGVMAEQATGEATSILAYDHRPVNIAFVLDRSGSMAGNERIENLRLGMAKFIGRLRDKDIVSIAAFDSYATVIFPANPLGGFRGEALHEIGRLDVGGSTNILDGLAKGYEEVVKNFKPDYANHLVILTDGYGDNPVEEVLALSKSYNDRGISCSTVGVGQDYNASLLELLASQGAGTVSLADSSAEMLDIFSQALSSSLFPIAENVEIEVEYDKHLLYAQLHGFEMKEKRPGKLRMRLRNMYANAAPQLALLKFTLVNPTQAIEGSPVVVRTKYFDIRKGKQVVSEERAYLKWSPVSGELEYLSERNDKRLYAVAVLNQALKVMADAFANQDRALAIQTLQQASKEVRALFPEAGDEAVEALMAELNRYLEVLSGIRD
jgi:uncharacterized protein YegL